MSLEERVNLLEKVVQDQNLLINQLKLEIRAIKVSQPSPKKSLDEFPHGIIQLIMEYVPQTVQIVKLSNTCKQLNEYVSKHNLIWYPRFIHNFGFNRAKYYMDIFTNNNENHDNKYNNDDNKNDNDNISNDFEGLDWSSLTKIHVQISKLPGNCWLEIYKKHANLERKWVNQNVKATCDLRFHKGSVTSLILHRSSRYRNNHHKRNGKTYDLLYSASDDGSMSVWEVEGEDTEEYSSYSSSGLQLSVDDTTASASNTGDGKDGVLENDSVDLKERIIYSNDDSNNNNDNIGDLEEFCHRQHDEINNNNSGGGGNDNSSIVDSVFNSNANGTPGVGMPPVTLPLVQLASQLESSSSAAYMLGPWSVTSSSSNTSTINSNSTHGSSGGMNMNLSLNNMNNMNNNSNNININSSNNNTYSSNHHQFTNRARSMSMSSTSRPKASRIISLHGHGGPVWCLQIDKETEYLVSGSYDTTVKIWNWQTAACIRTLRGHTGWISALAIDDDKGLGLITSTSWDGSVRMWDGREDQGRLLHCLVSTHRSSRPLYCLSLGNNDSNSGKIIVAGGYKTDILRWDAETGTELSPLLGHGRDVNVVQCANNGSKLRGSILSGGGDNCVKINYSDSSWEKSSSLTLKGHTASVMTIDYDQHNKIVSAGCDKSIKIWDLRFPAKAITTYFNRHDNTIFSCKMDVSRLITGSADNAVKISYF